MLIQAPTPTQAVGPMALLRGHELDWVSVPSVGSHGAPVSVRVRTVHSDRVMVERTIRCPVESQQRYAVVADTALFQQLVDQWRKERGATSSFTQMMLSPAYQRIIGMGERAIPLILEQLRLEGANPDHWGWALNAIAGEDPVPDDAAGDTLRIAQAWLAWGQSRNER